MNTTINFEEILSTAILLPLEQRLMLMQAIVNSLKEEIVPTKEEEEEWAESLSPEMRDELDRRLDLMESDETKYSSWDETKNKILEQLKNKDEE